jgi:hypothetical protein
MVFLTQVSAISFLTHLFSHTLKLAAASGSQPSMLGLGGCIIFGMHLVLARKVDNDVTGELWGAATPVVFRIVIVVNRKSSQWMSFVEPLSLRRQ